MLESSSENVSRSELSEDSQLSASEAFVARSFSSGLLNCYTRLVGTILNCFSSGLLNCYTRLVGTVLPSNHIALVQVYSIAIQD